MGTYRTGGFVGLAPMGEDTTKLTPVLEVISNMKKEGLTDIKPMFSFFFSENSIYNGMLTIGYSDEEKYGMDNELMTWMNMTRNKHYWSLEMQM
jgi:hypothetical protein